MSGLALHVVLTALLTWPLLGNLLSGSVATPGYMVEDRDQNLWNLWWVKTALLDRHTNPFFTDVMYWPVGVSLQFHTLNIFNGLISIPFQAFVPLPVIYNAIVFGSFVLAGWGTYLLLLYLLRGRPAGPRPTTAALAAAAAMGSSVFAYSAFHLATQRGLLQLISLEWVPFYVLGLLRAVHDAPSHLDWAAWRRWLARRALPAAGFLLLVALVDWYYVMDVLLFTAAYGVSWIFDFRFSIFDYGGGSADTPRRFRKSKIENRKSKIVSALLGIGVVVALFLAAVSPLLLSMFDEMRRAAYMRPVPGVAVADSADLLAFFIPPRFQQLWGALSGLRNDWPFGANQYEVYLGYVALGLAAVGLSGRRARAGDGATAFGRPSHAFWSAAGVLFGLLALGPVLQINGVPYPDVPLPYTIIERIPGLNISRSPDRFTMPLMLCLGVLAGYGVLRLAGRLAAAPRPPLSRLGTGAGPLALGAGLLGLLVLELWPIPYPQLPAPIPAYFQTLGQDPGDYAILELPREDSYWHAAFRMYFQTAHRKRIFAGYISREYYHPFLFSTPGFMELQNPDGLPDLFADGPPEWRTALAQYDTRYVVLYKAGWRERPPVDETARYRAALAQVIGAAAVAHPVHSDPELDVYRVPPPAPPVPYLSLGQGWERREATAQESHRWMKNVAGLRLDSPRPFHGTLLFQAVPLGPPRMLTVRRDGGAPVTLAIDGTSRTYRVDLGMVPAGVSTIDLSSPGPLLSPKDLGMSQDSRSLGLSFSQVRLEPAP